MRKSNDLSEALKKSVAHLAFELKRDPDYRRSWSANIAMAFKDAYAREARVVNGGLVDMHTVANQAAEDFLELLCMDRAYVSIQVREKDEQATQGTPGPAGKLEGPGRPDCRDSILEHSPVATEVTSKVLCARCVREVSAELDEIIGESTQTAYQESKNPYRSEVARTAYMKGYMALEDENVHLVRQVQRLEAALAAALRAPTAPCLACDHVDQQFGCHACLVKARKERLKRAAALIEQWMAEPGDYDERVMAFLQESRPDQKDTK